MRPRSRCFHDPLLSLHPFLAHGASWPRRQRRFTSIEPSSPTAALRLLPNRQASPRRLPPQPGCRPPAAAHPAVSVGGRMGSPPASRPSTLTAIPCPRRDRHRVRFTLTDAFGDLSSGRDDAAMGRTRSLRVRWPGAGPVLRRGDLGRPLTEVGIAAKASIRIINKPEHLRGVGGMVPGLVIR